MNKVILIGRLTKDTELSQVGSAGTSMTKFCLAVTRPFKKDETDFINCIAFGKTAENIDRFFAKGSPIAVTGRIQTGSYEANDGTKRYTTDVIVESFEFIAGNNSPKNEFKEPKNEVSFDDLMPIEDGDMPF